MENSQPKTNVPAQRSTGQQSLAASLLKDSQEAKQRLATRLYREFHAAKTYGKHAESLEAIIPLFTSALADYSIAVVERAFDLHSQRSPEFPTVSDIVGIIRRKGRAPVPKELYISISRKDWEERTTEEHRLMRRYMEEQESEEWDLEADEQKEAVTLEENIRLRQRVKELEEENRRLAKLLSESRQAKRLEPTPASIQDKARSTIEEMRRTGASEAAIEATARQFGI